ncbi:MAG: DHHA1 domain-containing protein [archaeon]
MKYLLGSKQDFKNFVDSITKEDKVGVVTHNDLDGIASLIFLEKILKTKNIKIKFMNFFTLSPQEFKSLPLKVKKAKLTKVFVLDINLDQYPESFVQLRENCDCFLIDHHTINPNLNIQDKILKTTGVDCVAFVFYDLAKDYIDVKEWNWLVCATMISEYSFKGEEQTNFIKSFYSDFNSEQPSDSEIGRLADEIDWAIIYAKDNLEKVYDLVKDKDLESIKKYSKEVEQEGKKWVNEFKEKAEYFQDKNIYFYHINPKFRMMTNIVNKISSIFPDNSILVFSNVSNNKNLIKVSARNQNKKANMVELLAKGIKGLKGAISGGHIPAAGGSFRKEDFEQFKKNILS